MAAQLDYISLSPLEPGVAMTKLSLMEYESKLVTSGLEHTDTGRAFLHTLFLLPPARNGNNWLSQS